MEYISVKEAAEKWGVTAKLTAFGFSVPEISKILHVSDSTVKQTIVRVINKTGIQDKSEFSYIL